MSYSNEFDYGQGSSFAIDAARDDRAAFIRRTYAHLGGALLAFAGLLYIFVSTPAIAEPLVRLWGVGNGLLVLGLFIAASWIANYWATHGTSQSMQYMGLVLYTVAEAVIFVPLVYFVWMIAGQPEILFQAGGLTLLIFGGLTAFVMVTGADFSFLRGFLFLAGLLAMGLIVIGAFGGLNLGIWFTAGMLGLSAGYILYDTSNVMHHYRTDQHVAASLALFASVALMFWYMIQLVLSASSD